MNWIIIASLSAAIATRIFNNGKFFNLTASSNILRTLAQIGINALVIGFIIGSIQLTFGVSFWFSIVSLGLIFLFLMFNGLIMS